MRKKLMRVLNCEDGSGLVLALMTLLVLSVLGASLGAITIGSHRLSSVNRDTTSAYYIAEAGVNQAYEEIKDVVMKAYESNPTSYDNFINPIDYFAFNYEMNNEENSFEPQFGHSPTATVDIKEISEDENSKSYLITSVGNVDNKSRVVEKSFDVTFIQQDAGVNFPMFPEDAALISKNTIDMSGGAKISGDVHVDSQANDSIIFDGDAGIDNGTIFHHPNVNSTNVIKMPSYYDSADYSVQKRSNSLPWNDYTQFVDNYKIQPEYKSKLDGNSYDSLTNFRYVHDAYNSHMIIQNNNINLDTYMVKKHDLLLNSDIRINNIIVGQNSTLNIETNRNVKINDISINSSNLYIKATGNSNSVEINNLTLNTGNVILDTGERNIDIHFNNLTINNNRIRFVGSGNVNVYINNNLTLNNGSIDIEGTGNYNFLAKQYNHNNGNLLIQNNAKVELNILEVFKFSSGQINNSPGAKSINMNLNYFGSSDLSIGGGVFMLGNLFLNQSNLTLTGSGNIQGLIISKGTKVDIKGGSINNSLILAPFSEIIFSEGGKVSGVVVADKIKMSGGTLIEYNGIYLNNLPGNSSVETPSPLPSMDSIINSGPVTEPR